MDLYPTTARLTAGTCKMVVESTNWEIVPQRKVRSILSKKTKTYDSTNTSEEGSSPTHPLKSFNASCLCSSLCPSLLYLSHLSLHLCPCLCHPSLFLHSLFLHHSISLVLVGSSWTYIKGV